MKNLKNFVACFFVLCFTNALHGQTPALRFQKSYGGTGGDIARAVLATNDGGCIVVATGASSDGDITCGQGGGDIWMLKLDSSMVIQWQKCLGGTGADNYFGGSLLKTNDGGYIMAGSTTSNDGDVSGNHSSNMDVWVVKLDSAFNLQWQKCLGGSAGEITRSIEATSDGGYIISAYTSSDNDGDVGPNHGMGDIWIVKTDSLANIQWQRCYGGSNSDEAVGAFEDDNGGYVFEGNVHSIDGDVIGNHSFNYEGDYWLVKTDSVGNILSRICFGGSDDDRATSLLKTADGGYLCSGYEFSANGGNVSGHHGSFGVSDIWIVKTDSALNLEWQKCLGGTNYDWGYQMIKSADGNYLIAGSTESDDYDVMGFHGNYGWTPDFWILKIDSAANIIWQKCIGGTEREYAFCLTEASDTSLIVGGYTLSNDLDAFLNVPQGNEDLWMINLGNHYNTMSGTVFLDTITNGIHDASEPVVANALISESVTGRLAFTDTAGNYDLPVFSPGSFTIQAPYVNYYPMNPSSYPIIFSGIDLTDSLNDFAGVPIPGMNDLSISITSFYEFVAGYGGAYYISYKNTGTTNLTATIKFFPDLALSYLGASITPSSVSTDSVVWSNVNLVPAQWGNIIVYVHVAPGATAVTSSVSIEPLTNDQDSTNNFAEWSENTVSSYDPNDKIVSDTVLTTQQVLTEPYLDYVIRFQNTGTAAAVNIKIEDNISKKLNLSTFELTGSSHPVQINYQQASRTIFFHFNNIMLPDSNSNESASHGFIRYRMKTVPNMNVNNKIYNHALIYFDFNAPLATNWTTTTIILPTGTNETFNSKTELNVFPNPVYDKLFIELPASLDRNFKLKIIDLAGRVVLSEDAFLSDDVISVDMHSLVPGMYFLELKSGTTRYNLQVAKQ